QVHVDDLVELFLGHLAHRRVAGDTGVVDHDVQRTEPVDCGLDEVLDLVGPGHVAGHGDGHVVTAEFFRRGLGRFEIDVAEHHPGALGDESLRDRETQTLCTTCDHRSLTGQQRHLRSHILTCCLLRTRYAMRFEYPISYRICSGKRGT